MIVILDSNEYITYLEEKSGLLDEIFLNEGLTIYINEIIAKETLRNINEIKKKKFYSLLLDYKIVAYDNKLPLSLLRKYRRLGLKKGDIAVAAFCESAKANSLITENRHFLKSKKLKDFKVLSLKEFLRKLK